jgi:hypothetical protein
MLMTKLSTYVVGEEKGTSWLDSWASVFVGGDGDRNSLL